MMPIPITAGMKNLAYALAYAALGWRVFPCHSVERVANADGEIIGRCSCARAGCAHIGKHPRTPNGVKDATTDEAQVREWWGRWPDANVAVACGAELWALDIDLKGGKRGDMALEALERQFGLLPDTLTARTQGGGKHLIFAGSMEVRNTGSELGDGIDTKGDGGYVLVEPSQVIGSYSFLDWDVLDGTVPVLAQAPDWLMALLVGRKAAAQAAQVGVRFANEDTLAELRSALHFIDSDDYHSWVNTGMALKQLGDAGFWLWDEWSATSDKYRADDMRRRWHGFDPKSINYESVFKKAQLKGWVNPRSRPAQAAPAPMPDDGFVPLGDFAQQASAPSYVVESVLRRGYLYSLTGFSNAGKTSIGLALALAISRGEPFGPHETTQGNVLILAGENPEDVRFRVLACAQHGMHDVTEFSKGAYVLPYRFAIERGIENIQAFAERVGGLSFILIDSKAAYFGGDKEDDNVQALAQAIEARKLTECAGRPTVLMIAHPAKHVSDQQSLVPRGGSAFLNEVDGNLTAWKDGEITELWWNKIRGFHWDAIQVQLLVWTLVGMTTERGTPITSVIAKPALRDEPELVAASAMREENIVLMTMHGLGRGASMSEIAEACGWIAADGQPYKMRVQRVLKRLQADRLVSRPRKSGGYVVTKTGKLAAEKALADGLSVPKK